MIVCKTCGTENREGPDFCFRCGAPLLGGAPPPPPPRPREREGGTAAAPAISSAEEAGDLLVLELFDDPSVRLEVRDGQVVGAPNRAKVPDVPVSGVADEELEFVSGHHARFVRRDSGWFVAHVGATNWIEVDGERCEDDTQLALEDGSVVVFTYVRFLVRLGPGGADHGEAAP
jgi:pSer/pThr/pTyr-binding forkhead associated (FHA) protein